MQVIRKIIELSKLRGIIEIPDNFQHTKVEIIILPLEEEEKPRFFSFNPEEFFGVNHSPDFEKEEPL